MDAYHEAIKSKVTEYGIYEIGSEIETINQPKLNTGVLTVLKDTRLISVTHKIPAIVGTSFGYCYSIPSNGKTITVTRKLVNPAMKKPDGTISTGYEYNRTLNVTNGFAEYCTNYTLEYEWEAIPGVWKFSVLLNGKVLVA